MSALVVSCDALRCFYANYVTAKGGVEDPRVREAFAVVERERFLGSGPWQVVVPNGYVSTNTADAAVLYQDILVGLVPEKGINNGEPSLHAKCIGEAAPKVGDVVVHVGAGAGYYTAIFAHLAGDSGRVYAYEIEPDLARRAVDSLAMYSTVTVAAQSGLDGALPMALSTWCAQCAAPPRGRSLSLVQHAHVAASHSTNARCRSTRWCLDRSRCRPTRKRFCTTPCTDANRCTWAADVKRRIWRSR